MTATHTFVPQLIKERRLRKGLHQLDLAERMGVARNTIIRWEKGDNPPDPEKSHPRKLAKVLGGRAEDYEWTEADYARRDDLIQIKLEVRAHLRRLMSSRGL